MRIIAGKFRSRKLRSLPGADIRPTSDRLRETLFNILSAGDFSALEASLWLDLFAGTGAVGIEALSRGAEKVYFVESSKPAAELIGKNLGMLGVEKKFQVLRLNVQRALPLLDEQKIRADFVFLDPPYAMKDAYRETLNVLAASPLSQTALVIAEHEKRFDLGEKFGSLQRVRLFQQGDAALSFYRRTQVNEQFHPYAPGTERKVL
jgi:16S rRNA (guanine(966)-N(2))-methyltransferase RsmD